MVWLCSYSKKWKEKKKIKKITTQIFTRGILDASDDLINSNLDSNFIQLFEIEKKNTNFMNIGVIFAKKFVLSFFFEANEYLKLNNKHWLRIEGIKLCATP